LKKVPEDARARVYWPVIMPTQGRLEEAKREADMAMALRPDDTMILYNTACVLCAMNNTGDALIAIKKAWEAGFRIRIWTRQGSRPPQCFTANPEFERL